MDAFKLAFETVIVGLLALPWLALIVDLVFPSVLRRLRGDQALRDFLSKDAVTRSGATLLLALAYCLGSAVSPLASEFLDDEHWHKIGLLPERSIRSAVYDAAEMQTDLPDAPAGDWKYLCRGSVKIEQCRTALLQLQEAKVLGAGTDRFERLRQLHEQIVVLRGTTFNGFVLFLLGLLGSLAPFGGCAGFDNYVRWETVRRWLHAVLTTAVSLCVMVFALTCARQDFVTGDVSDPPILEAVVIVVCLIGLVIAWRGVPHRGYHKVWGVALLFTILCYGGWQWTEATYDQGVITAYRVSIHSPATTDTALMSASR